MTESPIIDCNRCKHYFITWDSTRPRGCRYFGFKSKNLPSLEVYRNSGQPCQAFEAKDAIRRERAT